GEGQLEQRKSLVTIPYPSNKNAYTFYGPKRFGWVHLKKTKGYLYIGVYEKYAKQANVNRDGYMTSNSANNKPGYHWDISAGNDVLISKVADYLAEVCKVRHA
ncbi:hypothetical protein ACFLWU_06905, partial [Chloroflexota bacterium]